MLRRNILSQNPHSHAVALAGRLMEALGRSAEAVLATWARASALRPHRAEVAHAASRFCCVHGRNAEGCDVAEAALGLNPPASGLSRSRDPG